MCAWMYGFSVTNAWVVLLNQAHHLPRLAKSKEGEVDCPVLFVSSQHLWLPSLRPQEGSENGQLSSRGYPNIATCTGGGHVSGRSLRLASWYTVVCRLVAPVLPIHTLSSPTQWVLWCFHTRVRQRQDNELAMWPFGMEGGIDKKANTMFVTFYPMCTAVFKECADLITGADPGFVERGGGGAAATASAAGAKVFGGSRLKTLFGISKRGGGGLRPPLNPLVNYAVLWSCISFSLKETIYDLCDSKLQDFQRVAESDIYFKWWKSENPWRENLALMRHRKGLGSWGNILLRIGVLYRWQIPCDILHAFLLSTQFF